MENSRYQNGQRELTSLEGVLYPKPPLRVTREEQQSAILKFPVFFKAYSFPAFINAGILLTNLKY